MLDRIGIEHGSRVLDIGFGTTDELLALADIVGSRGTICGVESQPSDGMSGSLVKSIRNIRILKGDAHALPVANSSFDVVILKGVLHELDNVSKAMREAARACRIGGKVAVIDFAPFPQEWLKLSNQHWRSVHPNEGANTSPDKHAGFSKQTITTLVRRAGLSVRGYKANFGEGNFSGHKVRMFLAIGTKDRNGQSETDV